MFDSLDVLSNMLLAYREYSMRYQIPLDVICVEAVLGEMQRIVSTVAPGSAAVPLEVLDTLILLGVPHTFVARFDRTQAIGESVDVSLVKPDNVTVDSDGVTQSVASWRLRSYVGGELLMPSVSGWSGSGWKATLGQIIRGLAWCDGRARRAASEASAEGLTEAWQALERVFFAPMRLSLAERVTWDRSYAVPEAIFPQLYVQLMVLCLDCYPEKVGEVIGFIDERFSEQCGVYSEGFRATLFSVLSLLAPRKLEATVSDLALALAMRWKDYVLQNVQNRHELVPELLEMIPVFNQLEAKEEASRTYDDVLANSMGPSWYKEEQFSLMTSVLKSLPADNESLLAAFPQIEASLDAASGEITFQRFVRYAKDELIAELTRRGRYGEAARYFQRQVCGTQADLFAQANEGGMDKPSPMEGMRFPGGALDEQAAILSLLAELPDSAPWRACWALLEVYEKGDTRHVRKLANAFARLVASQAVDSSTLQHMQLRLGGVLERLPDFESQRAFLSALKSKLIDERFAAFLERLDSIMVPVGETGTDAFGRTLARAQETGGPESPRGKSESEATDEDLFLVPGLFGSRRVLPEASTVLEQSRRELTRRNFRKAKDEAVRALQILQEGQWSVWRGSGEVVRLAEEIIRGSDSTAQSLVQLYAPLLQAERHSDHWVIAEHLVERMGALLASNDQTEVVRLAIEHIERILGATAARVSYTRDGTDQADSSVAETLYCTLLWTLDHPDWGRREAAAKTVLWLVEECDEFLQFALTHTSFMESGPRADILVGALDVLSRERPVALWDRICRALDVDVFVRSCGHASRFATLRRIARRASGAGSGGAGEMVVRMNAALVPRHETKPQGAASTNATPPAALENDLLDDWRAFASKGIATDAVALRLENVLRDICAPLDADTVRKLERLLADGFGQSDEFWLTRWQSKVRYCLNVALFDVVTADTIDFVEARLRVHNPEPLRSGQICFPVGSLMESLANDGIRFDPSTLDQLFLSYQGYVTEGMQKRYVEFMPFLVHSGRRAMPPSLLGTFVSVDLPHPGQYDPARVCAQVRPTHAYFGALTPAIPAPSFLERTGLSARDFERTHWRERLDTSGKSAVHTEEGCMLSVDRKVFRLPDGYRLAWTVKVDGRLISIVDNY